MTLIFCLLSAALAAPGFDGVGGAGPPPVFGPEAPPDAELLQQVLAREPQILELVRQNDASMYERLLRLKESDRTTYALQLLRVSRQIERYQGDPAALERFRLIREKQSEIEALASGFEALSTADQKARRGELERRVGELMDLKQAERRARIEEIQARLAELQGELDQREHDRARIVQQYVDQALRQPVDL